MLEVKGQVGQLQERAVTPSLGSDWQGTIAGANQFIGMRWDPNTQNVQKNAIY